MTARIVEFPSSPEFNWTNGQEAVVTWQSKRSFDLNWVAGAEPWVMAGRACTSVLLAGSMQWFVIDTPYETFMPLWRGVSQ